MNKYDIRLKTLFATPLIIEAEKFISHDEWLKLYVGEELVFMVSKDELLYVKVTIDDVTS